MIDINKMYAIAEQSTIPYNRQLNDQLITLDEATYYGRNKTLIECEQILDRMVALGRVGGTADTEFTDLMDTLSDKLATLFGFKNVHINHSILCLNAKSIIDASTTTGFTYCHSAIIKYVKKIVDGKQTWVVDFDNNHKGIKFKPGATYSMRMMIGMGLFMPKGEYSLTGGEILAIILHEIGHNFYVGPIREISDELIMYATVPDLMSFVRGLVQRTLVLEGSAFIDDCIPKNIRTGMTNFINMVGTILSPIKATADVITIILGLMLISRVFANTINNIINAPSRILSSIFAYDSEKYSDAFATAYGYGTELSSALSKISHTQIPYISNNNYIKSIIDILVGIVQVPFGLIMTIIDPHPNNQGRLMNNIKYMEAAGNKITNPRLKKEYMEELNKMKALREQTKRYVGIDPIRGGDKLAAWVQDILNVSDWHDLTTSLNPKRSIYKNLDIPD